jgi:uncharacterized protein YbjT (DUF2867 family)
LVVVITGANGFIGSALARTLVERGHAVTGTVRDVTLTPARAHVSYVAADFSAADIDWAPVLAGAEAVVNTVGIFREHGAATFERVQARGAIALFDACARAGIRRVVQISALGADADATAAFQATKMHADDALLARIPGAVVVQPSLVFGTGGASARAFLALARLPLIPLPGRGDACVQPIAIGDVVDCIVALVERGGHEGERVPLVGPRAISLREMLAALRAGLRLPQPRFVAVPLPLMDAIAPVAERLGAGPLSRDALSMLARGNTADPAATRALLGHDPRNVARFIDDDEAPLLRVRASVDLMLPLLRGSIALMWIVSGLVSFGLYPVAMSEALLARAGVPVALMPIALYGAAALDVALGVLTLAWRGRKRRLLWLAQIAIVLAYTAVITVKLPEFWLHPYGPVLKNIPVLAIIALAALLEDE